MSTEQPNRKRASDFDQGVLDAYDDFAHGRIDRRTYMQRVAAFATAGMTAEMIAESMAPNYALAEQVKPDDPRIVTETITYDSPEGGGEISGLLAHPDPGNRLGFPKFPAVLVIHENRGLNPYVEDVVRRMAVAGFLAFGPDALSPLGGYPGTDDEGRAMQRKRDGEEMVQDFIAAAKLLDGHAKSTGKVGVVGFCFGGGMVNTLAVRIPDVIDAGVPFYGRQPDTEDVSKIDSPMLIHNAELDRRIMEGAAAYNEALKEAGVEFESHVYEGVNHGFHNDTTPRFDAEAAKLAEQRTVDWFKKHLNS